MADLVDYINNQPEIPEEPEISEEPEEPEEPPVEEPNSECEDYPYNSECDNSEELDMRFLAQDYSVCEEFDDKF